MRFWTTLLGLAGNKLVGPPVVLAAVGLALAAYLIVPARYLSTASMVLTISATGGTQEIGPAPEPGLTNPLLQFSDALRTTAGVLILSMRDDRVARELGVTEGGPTEVVVNDGRTDPDLLKAGSTGPFLHIEVEGASAATVRDVMAKARLRLRTLLKDWQTSLGAPPITHIGLLDVRPVTAPQPLLTNKVMGAAGGGVLGALAGAAAAYAMLRLRPERRSAADAEPPDVTDTQAFPAVKHEEPSKPDEPDGDP
ncbi:hypothetical protein ABZW11_21665 [Nonomuraea sp. NPDC004580]|uniref:hypothetical protein n=1 Tax=Nonomuraea sp. NPDC004580 TaxID=3154552 RepID=UPI0033ABB208